METDDWLYMVITWQEEQGLVFYINGAIAAVATSPTSTYDNHNVTAAGTLVFGRLVQY